MALLNSDAQNVRNWDNDHFVHPWEGMANIGQNDRTFTESGKGIYVTTDTGERLIDGPAGCCQTNANSSQFPGIGNLLGCADAAPLGKSGGAVELEI